MDRPSLRDHDQCEEFCKYYPETPEKPRWYYEYRVPDSPSVTIAIVDPLPRRIYKYFVSIGAFFYKCLFSRRRPDSQPRWYYERFSPPAPLDSLPRPFIGLPIQQLDEDEMSRRTDDGHPYSKASFYILPTEIRLQIYRLLLVSSRPLHPICSICKSVLHPVRAVHPRRLRVHPAILSCSQRINAEATPILYGENIFELMAWPRQNSISHFWNLSSKNISLLSRIQSFEKLNLEACSYLLSDFVGLKELEFRFKGDSEKWTSFARSLSPKLSRVERITIIIKPQISGSASRHWEQDPTINFLEEYKQSYHAVLTEHGIFPDHSYVHLEYRPAIWSPEENLESLNLLYRLPGLFRLVVARRETTKSTLEPWSIPGDPNYTMYR
ncbi:hypothetical protein G7Y89_g3623 [Cudoniella acicularis]|uniref:F-box domain-containing protein n=1 Tax=Cudoniella acicularis TaxID=354080 RepID=A0A8H4RRV4_9HELO|nr:hypothetical protein G7Y89_g3623 [Cudoniella acicularis]